MGWLKPKPARQNIDPFEAFFTDIKDPWQFRPNDQSLRLPQIQAPKINLPQNEDSFNPAPEYFEETIEPRTNLRDLSSGDHLLKDRFRRMMALYLAPRVKRKKIHMKAEQLLQELPDISQLKPFPEKLSFQIKTKKELLQSVSMSQGDQYVSIADSDNKVTIYHLLSGQ